MCNKTTQNFLFSLKTACRPVCQHPNSQNIWSQKQKREEKVCDQGVGGFAESSTDVGYADQKNQGHKLEWFLEHHWLVIAMAIHYLNEKYNNTAMS